MDLPNVYSRRKREAEGLGPDVWAYDTISNKLRIQIIRVIMSVNNQAVGNYGYETAPLLWAALSDRVKDDIGSHRLVTTERGGIYEQVRDEFVIWFEQSASVDSILDSIEHWIFVCISSIKENEDRNLIKLLSSGISTINARFKEAGVGYHISNGQIFKVGDELIHQEAVLPALMILRGETFEAANGEFRKAFDQFRAGEYEDCLVDCCKALESVLKVIGGKKGWGTKPTDSLSTLITAAFANDLIPAYMADQFNGLRSSLTAVGTIRNKDGGHGAGEQKRDVPEHLAAYQLHLTASAIVFLAKCAE